MTVSFACGRVVCAAVCACALVSIAASATLKESETPLTKIETVAVSGPYRPTWESLESYSAPRWYEDAKFGIFIHWGVYSVPGFGSEWYPRNMYQEGSPEFKHHVETFGPQDKFGYKDFVPLFKAEKFDPVKWATLFRRSGAKFVVPVAEHHDGFAMYDTALSNWNSVKMGPKRDIISELSKAIRKAGLVFGLSSHRAEHWWFFNGGRKFASDVQDPKYADFYGPAAPDGTQPDDAYLTDWLERTCELVDKYHPQVVWFDWWIGQPVFQPYLRTFASYYYNRGSQWKKGVAVNYKYEAYPSRAAVLDIERGQLGGIRPLFWQTDTSISKNSWGYVEHQDYKTAAEIIGDLTDIVSKNGALLLNIGPRPDGTIPEKEQQILLDIGRWLSRNGEAIYGTRPWKVFGEGPTKVEDGAFSDTKRQAFTGQDIRFTAKGDTLYAIVLGRPSDGRIVVKSLASGGALNGSAITKVEMLGHKGALTFEQAADGLSITLPDAKTEDGAFALTISPVDPAPAFEDSLTLGAGATASDVWDSKPEVNGAAKAVDGATETRWASASRTTAWLEVDLGKRRTFDTAWIDEWGPGGERIKSYELQAKDGDTWKTFHKGSTIGPACWITFPPVTAQVVRLNILEAVEPTINEFHLFKGGR